jgi:hypothetical protein
MIIFIGLIFVIIYLRNTFKYWFIEKEDVVGTYIFKNNNIDTLFIIVKDNKLYYFRKYKKKHFGKCFLEDDNVVEIYNWTTIKDEQYDVCELALDRIMSFSLVRMKNLGLKIIQTDANCDEVEGCEYIKISNNVSSEIKRKILMKIPKIESSDADDLILDD